MKNRNSQVEFLQLNGPAIAACAWEGYQKKGRGMICVLSDLENEVLQQVPFDFMPEIDIPKLIRPWYGTKESRMVSGYDPRHEVIVCFVRKAGDRTDLDSYQITTRPSPPQAAERAA